MNFEERLQRLERQNRRWKMATGGVLVLLVALVTMGQAAEEEKADDVMKVSKLLVTDKFCIGPKFMEEMEDLAEGDGGTRMDSGSIAMRSGTNFIMLTNGSEGGPILTLMGVSGDEVATVGMGAGKATYLSMSLNVQDLLSLGLREDGRPRVMLCDREGTPRLLQTLQRDGGSVLVLADKDGHDRLHVGTTELMTSRTGTVTKRPENSIVFYGPDGDVILKLPTE